MLRTLIATLLFLTGIAFGEDPLHEPRTVAVDGTDDARDVGEVDTQADDVWHDQDR